MRGDHPAHHPSRSDDRHVGEDAVVQTAIDADGPELRTGAATDDGGRAGRQKRGVPELEQSLQTFGPRHLRLLLLQLHLEVAHVAAQPAVLLAHLAERDVAAPGIAQPPQPG